jgi:iron complex outermembrane receptor protein
MREISSRLSGVVGLFYINRKSIDGTEESGAAQWRFSQSSNSNYTRSFEGYGIATKASINHQWALFANADLK